MPTTSAKKKYLIVITPWQENVPLGGVKLLQPGVASEDIVYGVMNEKVLLSSIRDDWPLFASNQARDTEESVFRLLQEHSLEENKFIYQRFMRIGAGLSPSEREWFLEMWDKHNLDVPRGSLKPDVYSVYVFNGYSDVKIWSKDIFSCVVIPARLLKPSSPPFAVTIGPAHPRSGNIIMSVDNGLPRKNDGPGREAAIRKTLSKWPEKVRADLVTQEPGLANLMLEQKVVDF